MLSKGKKLLFIIALITIILLISILFMFNIDNENDLQDTKAVEENPTSFTFFNMGANTLFSKHLRKRLNGILGSDSIEKRSTINLETHFKKVINNHFPKIKDLNTQFNSPANERVEHNAKKIMYRFAKRRDLPFDYIELLFSNYTDRSLMFRIESKEKGSEFIESIQSKYGDPKSIQINGSSNETLYWINKEDLFLMSKVIDRYGRPRYYISIFFVENLTEFLDQEKKEAENIEEMKKRKGKTAF